MQYFGREVAEKMIKIPVTFDLELTDFMIINKAWWYKVDFIAVNLADSYTHALGEEKFTSTRNGMNSGNIG